MISRGSFILFCGLIITGNAVGAGDCQFSASKASEVKEVKLRDGILKLGTKKISKTNHDPVIAWFQNGKQVFCRQDLDTTAADVRTLAATADKDHLYVAFTVNAGNPSEGLSRYTNKGWLPNYGTGAGPRVVVLLRLRKSDGEAVAGTYLKSMRPDGKTNSLALKKITWFEGKIQIEAEAWALPIGTSGTALSCSGKAPYPYSLTLTPDLNRATYAAAGNCR